jgi:putative membrane protein
MNPKHSLVVASLFLGLSALGAGCSDDDDNTTNNTTTDTGTGTTTDTGTGTDSTTAALTDADIGAIVSALNMGEIEQGNLAKDKAVRGSVKKFAEMMVTEHTAAQMRATALLTRLGITPTENATSTMVKMEATTVLNNLKTLSGSAFDSAYVDSQVTMHQRALDIMDMQLLPNAKNAELKAELTTARASVAMHLNEAKMLQSSTGDAGTETGSETGTETGGEGGVGDSASD